MTPLRSEHCNCVHLRRLLPRTAGTTTHIVALGVNVGTMLDSVLEAIKIAPLRSQHRNCPALPYRLPHITGLPRTLLFLAWMAAP